MPVCSTLYFEELQPSQNNTVEALDSLIGYFDTLDETCGCDWSVASSAFPGGMVVAMNGTVEAWRFTVEVEGPPCKAT